jgi:epoxyqueuosine reductase QueG
MVSFRGALALREAIELPPKPTASPCTSCADKPCITACPVDALSAAKGYDTAACHSHLNTDAGQSCLSSGCTARIACPISAGAKRSPRQSAFHMSYFHPKGVYE